ncbi:hypothetical protein OCD90_25825 [Bacillus pacificus]|uniref:hypothetical protein n=1 Tax=Bacillus pacificus TaxID=2026187 RepID=UPI0009432C64|nr:hypothetical protein [Bacillus pacificus]MCU5005729.1 hypothetical protein [Bacillus pacificus]MCU5259162.1 hypothetical protein [Bacillus pacificus]HDR3524224.1 hypothetical protein [Bacillus pacificus]HDR3634670.1 hypothetical protein [Bacillus pacificus]HDR7653453.1 hypothetical protein [Bacillus pacificus]
MIKAAIEYVVGLGNARIEEINGQKLSTQPMHVIKKPTAKTITVNNLSGLVAYIKSKFDGDHPLMVHIESPTSVSCFTQINNDYNRSDFIQVEALLPRFSFERYHDSENFNISLQSAFVPNTDRDLMLKVVGNIKEEAVNTVGDDGVSQSVVAKMGVATVGNVKVPNPVLLKPYRTFVEVEQPESNFIFRMRKGPECALFEADGGAWKLEAIDNIKEYLTAELAEEIQSKKVFIIA